jgi:hypothetical protein
MRQGRVQLFIAANLIACSVLAQAGAGLKTESAPRRQTAGIFSASGQIVGKVTGKTNEPKTVIDRVKLTAGRATIGLNSKFGQTTHNVSGSSNDKVFVTVTGLLPDTSATSNSYSAFVTNKGKTVIIKSSAATDTATVNVQIVVN